MIMVGEERVKMYGNGVWGRNPKGRPRLTWRQVMRQDLKMMGVEDELPQGRALVFLWGVPINDDDGNNLPEYIRYYLTIWANV